MTSVYVVVFKLHLEFAPGFLLNFCLDMIAPPRTYKWVDWKTRLCDWETQKQVCLYAEHLPSLLLSRWKINAFKFKPILYVYYYVYVTTGQCWRNTGNVRWVLFHWHVWNSDEWFGEVGQFEEEKLNTLHNKSVRTLNYYIRKKSYVTLLNLLINHLLKDQSYIAALMSSKSPLSTPASQSWYRDRILNEADRFF